MLVQVIKQDESVIYKQEIYKYGDVFEMDNAVAKSMMQRGYVKPVSDVQPEPEIDNDSVVEIVESESEQQETTDDLQQKTYQELKKLAKECGIDANGKKDELIERIAQYRIEVESYYADEMPNTDMPE